MLIGNPCSQTIFQSYVSSRSQCSGSSSSVLRFPAMTFWVALQRNCPSSAVTWQNRRAVASQVWGSMPLPGQCDHRSERYRLHASTQKFRCSAKLSSNDRTFSNRCSCYAFHIHIPHVCYDVCIYIYTVYIIYYWR